MPSKKDQLKVDLEMRWQILVITKEVLKFAHYFENPETSDERSYINRNRHLIFIKWSLWRLLIIELSKLFSDSENQKFNLIKLLRKIGPAGDFRSLKFNTDILKAWQETGDLLQESILEINRLRNKFYAHTESQPFDTIETTLNFTACYELIAFAEDIIRTLASAILKQDYIVLTPYFQSGTFDFIRILADDERANLEQIAKDNNMTYDQLIGKDS